MRKTHMKAKSIRTALRHSWGVILTVICALSLVAGLLLLVRLQVRAQRGPESVETGFSVEKWANTDLASPGDVLTYTIRVDSDLETQESELTMTDRLPSPLSLITSSLSLSGKGSYGWTGNVVTWTASDFGLGNAAVLMFSAEISDDLEGVLVNTAEVTGTGELITDAWSIDVVSGFLRSQIRLPSKNAYITEKETRTIQGIAWREGTDVPYLTEDTYLSLESIPGDEWSYWVQWTGVSSAGGYILEESTGPGFAAPTRIPSEDTSELFAKSSGDEGTYYYRVQAVAVSGDVTPTRWSNVVSVTVPWAGSASRFTSALPADGAADSAAIVQVRTGEVDAIESSEWQAADVTAETWDGWTWSYEWTLPEVESTEYLIQSRASEDGESFGPMDTISVMLNNKDYVFYFPLVFKRWPPVPFGPTLNQISNPDQRVDYRVSWSYDDDNPDVPDPTTYTLQEARDPSFNDPTVYDPDSATYEDIRDPAKEKEGGTYYYRVRGRNSYGLGEWSNIVSTQVRVLPRAPSLNPIDNADENSAYTVRWTYPPEYPPEPGFYVLQEAKDVNFTVDKRQYEIDGKFSKAFTDKSDGTYYYQVRGKNAYGSGTWSARSNPVKVESFSYFDDFSDPDSGWPSLVDDERWAFYEVDDRPPTPGDGSPYPRDGNGYFIARRSGGEPFAKFSPGVAVPSNNYEIEVDTRWWDARWYATYQILFGADRSLSNYYAVRVQIDDVIDRCRFSLVRYGGSGTKVLNGGWWDAPAIDCSERRDEGNAPWNHWKIRREGDWIKVTVNGTFLGQWKDSSFGANRYFGVRSTLYEGFTPSKPEYDNFSVKLLD